jgi:hypothetical protein
VSVLPKNCKIEISMIAVCSWRVSNTLSYIWAWS